MEKGANSNSTSRSILTFQEKHLYILISPNLVAVIFKAVNSYVQIAFVIQTLTDHFR